MKIKYEADDGRLFDSAEAAKAHEEAIVFKPLLGLDEARLMLALQRHPDALDIAEALEKAGTRIAALRRASGELKRRGKSEPEPAGGETPQVGEDETAASEPLLGNSLLETADREEAARAAAERVEGLPI